jgi:hypothetical protein
VDSEATTLEECTRDAKAAAAVLEAALETVATAAENKGLRQPSKRLVTVCCDTVRALSGAWVSG